MNIFVLDLNLLKCAQYTCDKHVVKMILEYTQMLSTAHRVLDGDDAPSNLYKATHINHPCNKWVRESSNNYFWLYHLLVYLIDEYTYRYSRRHKCANLLDELSYKPKNILTLPINAGISPQPLAMPDYCKIPGDVVGSYRNYYIHEKSSFATWKYRPIPVWYFTRIAKVLEV